MVLFTVLQALGLALLWVVKSFKQIALAFPFFVILMIPYRSLLKFIFTDRELSAVTSLAVATFQNLIHAIPSAGRSPGRDKPLWIEAGRGGKRLL